VPSPARATAGGAGGGRARTITVLYTTDRDGYLEPCGCQREPLGYIDRLAGLVAQQRQGGPTLLLETGDSLFESTHLGGARRIQEELKGRLLVDLLGDLKVDAVAVGETDAADPATLRALAARPQPRLLGANVTLDGRPLPSGQVFTVGDLKVGVFAVLGAELTADALAAAQPLPAARRAVSELKTAGAQVIIGLAHVGLREARRLAKTVKGIDFLIAGHLGDGVIDPALPERVGQTVLLAAGNHARFVGRLELRLDGEGSADGQRFAEVIGPADAATRAERMEQRAVLLRTRLAEWDKKGERGPFVEEQRRQLGDLDKQRRQLLADAGKIPSHGSYFLHQAIKIGTGLPQAAGIRARIAAYDKRVGELNCARAPKTPPPGRPTEARFVGNAECQDCHPRAMKVWHATPHSRAYETLVKVGKQFNEACVSCHVVGYMQPGGAVLCEPKNLEARKDVGCEACHGPGSLHVAAGGKEKPRTMRRQFSGEFCRDACHNPENSDHFDFATYLPKILGAGHGKK
jgi:hypothetical protein